MKNVLEKRVVRLEGRNPLRPYEHLTDDELDGRIADVAARIETEVGMDLHEYAEVLSDAYDAGEPVPDGMSKMDVQRLIASFRDAANTRGHHAQ